LPNRVDEKIVFSSPTKKHFWNANLSMQFCFMEVFLSRWNNRGILTYFWDIAMQFRHLLRLIFFIFKCDEQIINEKKVIE